MKSLFRPAWTMLATGALALVALPAGVSVAQEQGADEMIEEIVTIGTRREGRSAVDTAVPIDVFNTEELDSVSSDDLIDIVATLVPSFNVSRFPINDGASFVRPPQLRGLDADKTLVLVNGKRRHRAALVRLGNFGSHGPDLATIPGIAVKSVEVLRDGASALYGSDAIAGVMNFNLRDDDSGGELRMQAGQYTEDNEHGYLVAWNQGFALGQNGFINISAELSDNEGTSRGRPYDSGIGSSGRIPSEAATDVQTGVDANGDGILETRYGPDALTGVYDDNGNLISLYAGSDGFLDDTDTRYAENLQFAEISPSPLTQIWGEPERDAIRMFVNAGYELSSGTQIYAFANYSDSNSNTSFFHRRPGVSQLSILRTQDGSLYNPRNRYPAGFTPRFFGNVIDMSLVGGIRGEFNNGMTYDFSGRWGEDTIKYTLANTMNPSMGPATPTTFRPGDLVNDEIAFNADFSIPFDMGLASDVNFAFGFEYRDEGYDVVQGDVASYTIGPYASPDPWNFNIDTVEAAAMGIAPGCYLPGHQAGLNETDYDPDGEADTGDEYTGCNENDPIFNAVPVGSNGFPGYGPNFTSSVSRDSWAAYFDFEADVTDNFLATIAGRYEDFSDFGTNFSFRVAGRLNVGETLTLRGSAGTGFRAPTPGQQSTTNVSTRIAPDGSPVAEGIFPPTHPASAIFGAVPLFDETSVQYTAGLAWQPMDNMTLTLDYYFIELKDRIILSSDFQVGPEEVALLEAAGVPGANTIAQVSFFTNDVDTETSGIDLVATYDIESSAGTTTLGFSANWNDTKVARRTPRGEDGSIFFLNDEGVFDEELGLPEWRGVMTGRHSFTNDVTVALRGNIYGEYKNCNNSPCVGDQVQTYDGKIQWDMDINWDVSDALTLTFGGNNITDELPDRDAFENCCGQEFSGVLDWQGPYYYLRMALRYD